MQTARDARSIPPSRRYRCVQLALLVLVAMAAMPGTTFATSCGDGVVDAGEGCDDGNTTAGDGCSAACQVEPCFACAGEPSLCAPDEGAPCADDGNPCTDDQCTAAGVCDHPANAAPCNDGTFCNGADTCSAGSCSVHAGDPCPGPDGDANCSESCDEATDTCSGADPDGSPCDDGLFCTGADTCSDGTCSVHTSSPCPGPDGDANCSESCNEATDACTAPDPNGSPCDDGLFCTGIDFCAGGTCSAHTNDPCPGPDGDANCSESCDEATDTCSGADPDGSPCDDGLFCTGADTCNGGTCSVHTGSSCPGPDGDANCNESCDEATHTCAAPDPNGSPCNDGLYCTVGDSCTGGSCGGAPRDCNAVGDQCHDGVCDEDADACVGPPKAAGTPCDDGSACTTPDTCDAGGTCTGVPDPAACLDYFTCYKAGATSGAPRFVPVTNMNLTDEFRTATVSVTKPRMLCLPTDRDGNDPAAPTHPDHLEDYQAKPVFTFAGAGSRSITNEFGTVVIVVQKPVALQVPTLKSLTAPPGPLSVPAVDHFHCYQVKIASGQPRFQRFQVPITDQFGLRLVTVMKPRRLCAPVDKDGEAPGAAMHPKHLLCYQIKEFSDPKFTRVRSIFTHPEFGPETLDAKKPVELCVPSTKIP